MQTSNWEQRRNLFARRKSENNGWMTTALQRAEERMRRAEESLEKRLEIFFRNVRASNTLKSSYSDGLEVFQEDLAQPDFEFQSRRRPSFVADAFQRPCVTAPKGTALEIASSLPPHDLGYRPGLMTSMSCRRENCFVHCTTEESCSHYHSNSSSLRPSAKATRSVSVGSLVRRRLEQAEKNLNHRLAFLQNLDQLYDSDLASVHSDCTSILSNGTSILDDAADALRSTLAEIDQSLPQSPEESENSSVYSTGSSILRRDLAQAELEFLSGQEYEKRSVTLTDLQKPEQEFCCDGGKLQDLEVHGATWVLNEPFMSEECCSLAGCQRELGDHSVDWIFSPRSREQPVDSSFGRTSEVIPVDSWLRRTSDQQPFDSVSGKLDEQSLESLSLSSHVPEYGTEAQPRREMNNQSPPGVITLVIVNENWSNECIIVNDPSDDEESCLCSICSSSTSTYASYPAFVTSKAPLLPAKFLENQYKGEQNPSWKAHGPERSKSWLRLMLAAIFLLCQGCYFAVGPAVTTTAIDAPFKLEAGIKSVSINPQNRKRIKRNTRMLVVDRRNNNNIKGTRSWTGIAAVRSKKEGVESR